MKNNIVLTLSVLLSFFAIYFYSLSKNKEDTVYFYGGIYKNLFNEKGDGFHNLAHSIKEKGYKVKETRSFKRLKNVKHIIVFDIHKKKFNRIKRIPKQRLTLFTWEPPVVIPENHDQKYHRFFSKVYTFNDDVIDNQKYFKFYYPDLSPMLKDIPKFEDKKLCCLIASNKTSKHKNEIYTERENAIRYFEEYAPKEFDLFGGGWNKENFPSYQGVIGDKAKTLPNYKFSICYENTKNMNGYITEKIFHSFHSGCVPIYLGAENITDYIPSNCFIDKRNFKSYNELFVYLKRMSKEDYLEYLENIQNYLNSEKAKLFSVKVRGKFKIQQIRGT